MEPGVLGHMSYTCVKKEKLLTEPIVVEYRLHQGEECRFPTQEGLIYTGAFRQIQIV